MVICTWNPEQVSFVTWVGILSLKEKNSNKDLAINPRREDKEFSSRPSGLGATTRPSHHPSFPEAYLAGTYLGKCSSITKQTRARRITGISSYSLST